MSGTLSPSRIPRIALPGSQTTIAQRSDRELSRRGHRVWQYLPSSRAPPKESGKVFSQWAILPKRQGLQRPHFGNVSTTESPGVELSSSVELCSNDPRYFSFIHVALGPPVPGAIRAGAGGN